MRFYIKIQSFSFYKCGRFTKAIEKWADDANNGETAGESHESVCEVLGCPTSEAAFIQTIAQCYSGHGVSNDTKHDMRYFGQSGW